MTLHRTLVTAVALACLVAGTASAQSPWGGNVALGYGWPLGTASDNVSGDIAFGAGLRYAPEQWPVGLRFEFQWNEFDPKGELLDQFHVGDGNASVWSITANVEWNRRVSRSWGYYLIGGVGYYDRELELTEPGVGFITVCDPWWGICWNEPVAVDKVIGSYSDSSWGLNGGFGVTFPISRASDFYIEARYHWIDNDGGSTQYIPLMLGFRF